MAVKVNIEKNFRDFSLKVDFEGSSAAIGLLGASGSGKSMTLRCIAGIETPDKGRIVINGKTVFDSEAGINLKPQKRRIGYLFQNYALFPTMTVEQNIRCGYRGEKSSAREKVADLIRRYHLEGLEKRLPSQLSGGQQQRVALARMMIGEPEAILLDEPFSALDTFLKWNLELELADLLADFPGPILWVSHDLGECYRNCKTVCVMENGRSGAVTDMQVLVLHPATQDAARLAGCRNFLPAHRCAEGVQLDGWALTLPLQAETEQVTIAVPDSAVTLHTGPYSAVVSRVIRDLDASIVLLRPEHQNTPLLRTALPKNAPAEPGQTIRLDLRPEACLCYPSEQARAAAFK